MDRPGEDVLVLHDRSKESALALRLTAAVDEDKYHGSLHSPKNQ
jgi:hypothetical protein